jgi:uncharacterized membrane protein YeaQ/YmgE (transglycosylase-associated protein family)
VKGVSAFPCRVKWTGSCANTMTTPEITIPAITLPSFVVTLVIAGLCGALAQLLVGYTRGGCIASLLVGFIGALIGSWLASTLHMPTILPIAGVDVVWTIIGAAIFTALLALIMGGSRRVGWYRYRRNY